MKDYSQQILSGEGDNDYVRYMRTDRLLDLQRRPDDMVHRDELLFQIVHQSTELWLKLACTELRKAADDIDKADLGSAIALLTRASLAMGLITDQLEMMRHLSPWDFQTIRTVLGHGSGSDSPGWISVRRDSRTIGKSFTTFVQNRGVDLVEVYRVEQNSEIHRLAEAMIEWDERVSLWRVRHFKITARLIGHHATGTQGTPVAMLTKLISHRLFPELWEIRSFLTETGPMAQPNAELPGKFGDE